MKLKMIIMASVLVTSMLGLGIGKSYAINQTIDLSSSSASFIGIGPLLDGGDDVLTFTNLAVGTYNFDFSMSSMYTDVTGVLVNGQAATGLGFGVFKFFGLSSVSTSPFTVEIFGASTPLSMYSGELKVTAVPEPAISLLMLLGLGMACVAARHHKNA